VHYRSKTSGNLLAAFGTSGVTVKPLRPYVGNYPFIVRLGRLVVQHSTRNLRRFRSVLAIRRWVAVRDLDWIMAGEQRRDLGD
jgi:hypothetical protein